MKLISWNVNGLRACMGKGFGEFVKNTNADVYCIQETKMNPSQAEIHFDGYYEYWNSAEKKGYSGTAVFTKIKPKNVFYGIGIEEHDHEGRVITLEFDEFFLVNVYTPNSKQELNRLDYRMKWEDAFKDYLLKLDENIPVIACEYVNTCTISSKPPYGKPIIICGDLNVAHREIDLKNPKANERSAGYTIEERGKFDELLSVCFVDTFRHLYPEKIEYSWWSYRFKARERNAGWRIDYFLISARCVSKVKESAILGDVLGSDHAPVLLELNV